MISAWTDWFRAPPAAAVTICQGGGPRRRWPAAFLRRRAWL